MTPESFHLTRAPKLSRDLKNQIEKLQPKILAERRVLAEYHAKRNGMTIPKNAPFEKWGHEFTINDSSGVRIQLRIHNVPKGECEREADRLTHRKRVLCKELNTGGAKRFAAFVKTKYGKELAGIVLENVHEEWLDLLSNCEC